MNYHYYQKEGGNEKWSPIPDNKLDTITDAMFVTILSVDSPVSDDADKESLAAIKFRGPLYFDLDDADSPASTAVNAVQLVKKLEELGIFPAMLEIYATGGKGFHMLVSEECFLTKPPKAGLPLLPAIYKEMAFNLAVDSLDLVVYTARKGRMFRQANVLRPNGMHKVRIAYTELVQIADMSIADKAGAESFYKKLCSTPRRTLDIEQDAPELAMGMLALFDQCKSKVSKAATARKKYKPVRLPDNLPSFDALLRGEGVKSDAGFHKIAMQVAITAHARGIGRQELIDAAEGLCDLHDSDGSRYNSAAKRREEIGRMWDYTEDNACYTFSSGAIKALLTHNAPDLQGLDVSDKEVMEGIQDPDNAMVDDPYDHAGVTITDRGAYTMSENGPKRILALGFENVTELVSAETNQLTVIEVDVNLGGKALGHKVIEVDTFNSVNNFNKLTMPYGQSFNGTDAQARGMMMRLVEKARRSKRRMYVVAREGLDIVSMPFHEDEEARKEFLVWADIKSVTPEPSMQEKDIKLRFVGFPDVTGQYKTDLSLAPALIGWKKEEPNEKSLETMLENLLTCQKPAYIGKLLGWMVACHYRMLFNKVYNQFPLLHINGAAGMGKCFAKGTKVRMADNSVKHVEDVVVGDLLLGPDGSVRNVLTLGRGSEMMYRVDQNYGDSYTVNASHILSLKGSSTLPVKLRSGKRFTKGAIVNIEVKDYLTQTAKAQDLLKGWKSPGVVFTTEQPVELDPYMLGSWLGDGFSSEPKLGKPKTTKMYKYWMDYCLQHGLSFTEGNSGTCDTIYIKGGSLTKKLRDLGVFGCKHIPSSYMVASTSDRLKLLAGLIDSDGTVNCGGYRFDTVEKSLGQQVLNLCRSLGFKATISESINGTGSFSVAGTMQHVYITGAVEAIPTLDKRTTRKHPKDPVVAGIQVTPIGQGDYYGFEIDGDRLFLLEDWTVVHNTAMTRLFANLHYYNQDPKMLTPTSTLFAVSYAASGSASIPLILDEFKPSEMNQGTYDRFKLMLRDAYNCRNTERGGGNRDNSDYRALHTTALSAPICFIAEAAESETALMERIVLLTLSKPPVVQAQEFHRKFSYAQANKNLLGILGGYMAAQIVQRYSTEMLREEFDVVYGQARKDLMLQAGEAGSLSAADLRRKSGAKERTVYNYSVAKFGLVKFKKLLQGLFPGKFDDVMDQMLAEAYSTVEEIQVQTIPEWLKVMNNLADMAKVDSMAPYFCKEGSDFAIIEFNGKTCLELYARAFYIKYRVYSATSRTKPLFPNEAAFIHGLGSLPALESTGMNQELSVPGGSHIFDLDQLRGAGFISPE